MKKGDTFSKTLFKGETKLTSITINVGLLPAFDLKGTHSLLQDSTNLKH